MSDNSVENLLVPRRYIVIGGLVIAALFAWYFIWFFGINKQSLSTSAGDWGTFGDFFGGILNPIFAGAGLLLLLATLRQNEKVLKQAERMIEQGQSVIDQNAAELRASRDELKQSRKAQERLAEIERQNQKDRVALDRYKFLREVYDARAKDFNYALDRKVTIIFSRETAQRVCSLREAIIKCEHMDAGASLVRNKDVASAGVVIAALREAVAVCKLGVWLREKLISITEKEFGDVSLHQPDITLVLKLMTFAESLNIDSNENLRDEIQSHIEKLRTILGSIDKGREHYSRGYEQVETFGTLLPSRMRNE